MNDIVVFIPYDMESELMKKSADLLRIQQIDNNTQNIIIVGCPHKKEESDKMPMMTISELAIVIVDLTVQEANELHQQVQNFERAQKFVIPPVHDIPPISLDNTQTNKHIKFVNQSLKRFNQVKQNHKQIFFNRTRHK